MAIARAEVLDAVSNMTVLELSTLIHWSRERVLAGLGIGDSEEPGSG